ncbi:7510_t:CDS:2 [Diversispora eburnea]|uniref:7510_t:CDS:1 n=1 Tax=Diversispora eburnea TaxID=1213867 RepID=A0A9N8V607_9GLOM|nr:7510_t:CDS:2 [Diversispora eburnea]
MAATATAPINTNTQTTTVAGGGPSAGQKVNTSEVGWLFVHEYYTFLNKEPSRLHCFYGGKSTLIHGYEGEQVKPCQGEKEIQEKIQELDLDNCRVLVTNVDSQASQNGGIVIQVLGEMSNRGESSRKFAQTFFLAVQPNGYFVLNDIIRFLKEDEDIYEESDEVETEIPSTIEETMNNDEEVNSISPSGTLVEEPINNRSVTESTTIVEVVDLSQIPTPTDTTNDVTVNGVNGIEVSSSTLKVKDETQVIIPNIESKEEPIESVQPPSSENVTKVDQPKSSAASISIDNVTKVDQPKSSPEISKAASPITSVKSVVNSQVVSFKSVDNVPSPFVPSQTALPKSTSASVPDRLLSSKPIATSVNKGPPTTNISQISGKQQTYAQKSTTSVPNGQPNQMQRNVSPQVMNVQNANSQREGSPIRNSPTIQNSVTPVVNGHGQRSTSPVENSRRPTSPPTKYVSDQNPSTKHVNGQPITPEINAQGSSDAPQKNGQIQTVSNQVGTTPVSQTLTTSQQANGHVTSVAAPVQKTQQKSTSQQQRQHNMRDNRDHQDRRQDGNRSNNRQTGLSIYVKGITQSMNRESLLNAFKVFGYVSHIDVVYSKSCAFIEYNNAESYKAALNAQTIKVGNESVSTEERRGHSRRNNNKPPRGRY